MKEIKNRTKVKMDLWVKKNVRTNKTEERMRERDGIKKR